MQSELISVIIPVYNVEKYLTRCIDSVLAQTYTNTEVILVDDGSTDKSGEICDEYLKKDKRVIVIHKENGGLSDARNIALNCMMGQWITFIDSDDYISVDYIEVLYNLCILNDTSISCGAFERTSSSELDFEKSNYKKNIYDKRFNNVQAIESIYGRGEGLILIIACAKLFKATVFCGQRFKCSIIHEDEELVWKLLYTSSRISATNKIIYAYYMSDNSIMRSDFSKRELVYLDILQERIDFFKSKNEDELYYLTLKNKCYALQDYYCKCKKRYPQETALHMDMRKEFLELYPQAMSSKYIPLKSKLCLLTMKISPEVYQKFRG